MGQLRIGTFARIKKLLQHSRANVHDIGQLSGHLLVRDGRQAVGIAHTGVVICRSGHPEGVVGAQIRFARDVLTEQASTFDPTDRVGCALCRGRLGVGDLVLADQGGDRVDHTVAR